MTLTLIRCWLDYHEIVAGGKLDLVLGLRPNQQWGDSTLSHGKLDMSH